ncbi:hypothetical protein SLS62_000374 [Diatrype stigma]|uniref:Uncharacterized protein n=1 Tax=Diatrype stigma TaxID=117547 RepID=A0AAN9V1K4_9PEZI
MAFITKVAGRRMALAARASVVQAPRQFSTSLAAQKSATETVKDSLKTVDRKVSDKLVDGINVGAAAAEKVKGATTGAAESAKGSAEELRGEAKGKASELKGEAKGAAKEAEGKVKGSL